MKRRLCRTGRENPPQNVVKILDDGEDEQRWRRKTLTHRLGTQEETWKRWRQVRVISTLEMECAVIGGCWSLACL
ncbi:hypothetical protein DPX16_14831 [Anabarilius grahami]|uniref:Uncharacterized protein n=1 Tax=Anabarilius grahami TaxID=495550 RepID=A0A3N0YVE4_ANAGA|nr:hypothetical protein DPX16_14831 [Anabarilius grahami]